MATTHTHLPGLLREFSGMTAELPEGTVKMVALHRGGAVTAGALKVPGTWLCMHTHTQGIGGGGIEVSSHRVQRTQPHSKVLMVQSA